MRIRNIILNVLICFISIIPLSFSFSSDFTQLTGASSVARNGLGIVSFDGLSNVMTNPAGLASMNGRWFEVSGVDRLGQYDFDNIEKGLYRSFRSHHWGFNGGAFYSVDPSLALAIAYHRLIDYRIEWPFVLYWEKGTGHESLAFDMYNRLLIDAISPSVGVKFGKLSIGLTANIYWAKHRLAFPLGNDDWFNDQGEAGYQFSYKQDGWSYGGILGCLYQISENMRVGFKIQSMFEIGLDGEAKSSMFNDLDTTAVRPEILQVSTDFKMPWVFGVGFALNMAQYIELNLDGALSLWDKTKNNLVFQFSDGEWNRQLDQTDSKTGIQVNMIPLELKNSFDLGFGISYTPPSKLSYRAGYRYNQSPISEATNSMFFPSLNQHWFSAGIGYHSGPFIFNASIAYGFGEQRKINAEDNPFWYGKYDSGVFIQSVSFGYSF